ncbi:MFS transporter [Paraburkholderia jirisanensis]
MRALAGLLAGYTVLIAGNSLLTTLLSLRLVHAGAAPLVVGLVQSCYYVGFVLGALALGPLVARIGPQRAFIGCGASAALAALGYLSFESAGVWALLRVLTGMSMVGIFTSIESGVNAAVANGERGRAFAIYLVLTYLGVSGGQFLLAAGDAAGDAQRVLVDGLFVFALMPVALIGDWSGMPVSVAPTNAARRPAALLDGLHELLRVTPRSVAACVGAGLVSSAFYAMTPVYLARIGYPAADISHLMGTALFGALLSQWPVGRLSDRFERRRVLGAIALAAAVASALLVTVRAHAWVGTLLFVYVALSFALYGVIVADVNDRVDPTLRVKTSATLLLVFSLGGSAGPTLASLCVRLAGASGLFVFSLAVTGALAWLARRE